MEGGLGQAQEGRGGRCAKPVSGPGTKVWASRGVGEGVGAGGAAKVSPGEKPSRPQSILIPHQ